MLINKSIFILLILISSSVCGVAAGDVRIDNPANYEASELYDRSTLDDYLLYAMANNSGLRASYERWKAAVEVVPQAGALPEPRLGYGYFIRQVETRVGPQVQRFGISQAFPWFGKLSLAQSRAAAIARAAARQFDIDRLKLLSRVQESYYDYWFLGRRIEITRANRQLLEQTEEIARNRYSTGSTGFSQLLKLQVEIGKLEDMVASLEDVSISQAASFNALLGRDPSLSLPFPSALDTLNSIPGEADLSQALIECNPSLARLRELQQAAGDGVKLAGKQRYPNLMFGLDYIQTDPSSMANVADNGKDPLIASVSINLPLSFGKYDAAKREAVSRLDALHSQENDLALTLNARLKRNLVEYADHSRKMELYGNTLVPKAEQMLEASISGLTAGSADALDVLDAQRTLLSFQLEYERSIAGLAKVSAAIDELTGGAVSKDRISKVQPEGAE